MSSPDVPQSLARVPYLSWWKWYRDARAEMAFRYGLRDVPTDVYKAEFYQGKTVSQAVRIIGSERQARGSHE